MGYLSNYGLMIPQGPFREPPKPSYPKRQLCRIFGHHWRNIMVTTTDKTLPEECTRCGKKRWLRYNHWRKRAGRLVDRIKRIVDFLLHPLCYVNSHRWIGTYGFTTYEFEEGASKERHEEKNYVCARCRKTKTVKIS